MFYVTDPRITDGANFIKLLLLLFTNVRDKQVFVPGKPFLLSLLFTAKTGAYPSEIPFRCSNLG